MKDAIWHIDNKDVKVTHLDKIFWPDLELTKGDMLTYYKEMAEIILPYFHHRPATMKMYPDGITGLSYYMRDYPAHAPSWITSFSYQPVTVDHPIRLSLIENTASLLWFANHAAIEFHMWLSKTDHIHTPDMVVFDLDAGKATAFHHVCEAAMIIKERLAKERIQAFPKTTGGKGMHIFVPIKQVYSFEQVRLWMEGMTNSLATAYPKLLTHSTGAMHEKKLISIDYAQNSIGKNTAIPYTLRSTKQATVSTPLTWEEVGHAKIVPEDFTIHTIKERMKKHGDLFLPILEGHQTLPI